MEGKNDYGFNAEEAINSLRPDTPKRQSREIQAEESHETIAAAPKSEAAPKLKKASEKRSGKTVPVDEYMEWLKGKTDFNTRAGKSCNIVLGEHLKKYEEAMDAVMKQKFNEMQELINNEE